MKPCFNLVVEVWFSMSSGRAFQCQGMNAGPEVGGVSGLFGRFVSQIANLTGTTMLRSLVKATQGACQDEISSIQLIGLFGKCEEGCGFVYLFVLAGAAAGRVRLLRS